VQVAALQTESERQPDDRERTVPDGDVSQPPENAGAAGDSLRGGGLGEVG
jgi:hypothetical protein